MTEPTWTLGETIHGLRELGRRRWQADKEALPWLCKLQDQRKQLHAALSAALKYGWDTERERFVEALLEETAE